MPHAGRRGRTEIGPVQGLVREPDLEPPAALLPIELDDRQARAVDRNRVPDVAVAQDGRGVPDRERAPARVMQDVRDGPEVLDLYVMHVRAYAVCVHGSRE